MNEQNETMPICYRVPCNDPECAVHNRPALNTDRDLWRELTGDYYANRVFLTKGGGIGMDVGGLCIVKSIKDWHTLASKSLDETTSQRR